MNKTYVTRTCTTLLLGVGLMQMVGDLTGLPALKGIGAASVASPAPKVFSSAGGLETYSTRFFIEWIDTDGNEQSLEITPEVYAKLRGPYNRRNVYGTALAYGPVLAKNKLTAPMLSAVMKYGLCGDAPLLREFGIDPATVAGDLRVRYEPLEGTDMGRLPRELRPPCR